MDKRKRQKSTGCVLRSASNKSEFSRWSVISNWQFNTSSTWTVTSVTTAWRWPQFTCLAAPVPCTRSRVPKIMTCTLENAFLTFLSFPFVHRCPGCAALTKMVIRDLFFSTHQHSGNFPSFLRWAPRVNWVHSKYTKFYRDTWSIEWATTKMLFGHNLCMFPKKAAWPIFLKTAINRWKVEAGCDNQWTARCM